MQFTAKARYIRFSPYKLRPLVDVVRGKDADYALNWFSTCALKRVRPLKKILESAVANAKSQANLAESDLVVREFCVDEGPTITYYKPGAMGRANLQRRRLSHLKVMVAPKVSTEQSKKKEE
ncbi:50S ribosomal protein L22 [Candidatus Babeliales bacterium]|nr:50S ribosomal protein L22 [Candidatus Babeliales bacterium]